MVYKVHSATPFEVTYKVIKDSVEIGKLTLDKNRSAFRPEEGVVVDEAIIAENADFHRRYVETSRSIS